MSNKVQLSLENFDWFDAIESKQDGLLLLDQNGSILKFNHFLVQILEQKESPIGQSFQSVFPEIDLDRNKLIRGKLRFKQSLLQRDGHRQEYLIIATILDTYPSQPLLVKFESQTERNSLQKQVSFCQQQLKAVFTEALEPIILINERGIIQNTNPATTKLFGFEKSEMVGANVSILMPTPHKKEHDGYIRNYVKTGQAKIIGIGREVIGQKKDGSTFPLRLGVSEVKTNNGILFTGIIHDLTEEKATARKIKKLNQTLEEKVKLRTEELSKTVSKLLSTNEKLEQVLLQRKKITDALKQSEAELKVALNKEKELGDLKSRFVTMASHEFRTPLSSILSSAELVEMVLKKKEPEKAQTYLDRISNSVKSLTNILNDFLSLGKLEEGEIGIQLETFNFPDLLFEIEAEFIPLLKDGQKIIIEGQATNKIIESDRRILKLIISNLISNASKYSSINKNIYCRYELLLEKLIITIQDQGIGIPPEDVPHLFGRFFRASNVTNIQGTGLGLNIVKRTLDLLNGTITLVSSLESGTTFKIEIPLNLQNT